MRSNINDNDSDDSDDSATAVIEKDAIVIRLPLKNLDVALRVGCSMSGIDPPYRVTDSVVFAKEVVRELNSEDEEGTTAIHRMFDAAFIEAIEQGAEGVEECSADDEEALI